MSSSRFNSSVPDPATVPGSPPVYSSIPGSVPDSLPGSMPGSASAASSYFSMSSASRYVPNTNEPSSVSSSYKSAAPASYHTAFSPFNPGTTPHLNSMPGSSAFHERSAYFGSSSSVAGNPPAYAQHQVWPAETSPQHSPQSHPPHPDKSRVPSISGPTGSDSGPVAKQHPTTTRTSLLTSKLAAAAAATSGASTGSDHASSSSSSSSSTLGNDSETQSTLNPSGSSNQDLQQAFFDASSRSHSSSSFSSSAFPYQAARGLSGSIRKKSPRSSASNSGAFGTSPYQASGSSVPHGSWSRYQHRSSSSLHRHGASMSSAASQNAPQSFLPHPASTTTNVTMAVASGTSTPHSRSSFSTAKSSDSDRDGKASFSRTDESTANGGNVDTQMDVDSQPGKEYGNTNFNNKVNNQNGNDTTKSGLKEAHDQDVHMESATPCQPAQEPEQVDRQHLSNTTTTTTNSANSAPDQTTETQAPTANQVDHLDIANHPVPEVIVMLTALLQKIIDANDALHPHHYQTAYAHNSSTSHNSSSSSSSKPSNGDITNSSDFTANVLAFHGRNVPAIGLEAYLHRILKYCPTTNEVFISLLVYFDRIAQRANSGELANNQPNQQTSSSTNSTSDNNNSSQNSQDQQDPSSSSSSSTSASTKKQLFVMDSYNIHRLIIAGVTVASKFFSDVFYKNSRYAKVGGLPIDELNHLELQFLLLTDFKLMIPLEELQRYADLLLGFWKKEQEQGQVETNSSN